MVKIISDSTCDLSNELCQRYGVELLPLHILLGEEDRVDRLTVTPEQLYTWSDAHQATPKTAAFSVEEAKSIFQPHLAAGDDLVCFSISAQMSASCQNMRIAAEELHAGQHIRVIDSARALHCKGCARV